MSDSEEPTTRELRVEQARREQDEKRMVERSDGPNEAAQHERRREKASYLEEKLAERERSEAES